MGRGREGLKCTSNATYRPAASSSFIKHKMSVQLQRDTKPEMAIRRILHARGYRYRVDYRLPGIRQRADIAFPRLRIAVFVDGCFWHSCPQHGTTPRRNRNWWVTKFEENKRRDADTNQLLTSQGWTVIRFWEHERPDTAVMHIEKAIMRLDSRNRWSSNPSFRAE